MHLKINSNAVTKTKTNNNLHRDEEYGGNERSMNKERIIKRTESTNDMEEKETNTERLRRDKDVLEDKDFDPKHLD